ncbi:MAG: HD domain-containing protein [Acidobacteriota bacterium]|nr:HD domain-containing protein [Acidobacteriota bacterium]
MSNSFDERVEKLLDALHTKDIETSGHTTRVARLAVRLGRAAGLSAQELTSLHYGALLHDVGKLTTRIEVLQKPGKLDAAEQAHMRAHALAGEMIVGFHEFPFEVIEIVAQHHERYDGEGYPRGLKGDEICRGARVFAVADTLDAMTSNRCYRRAPGYTAARAEIERCSGSQFDPLVVAAFLSITPSAWTNHKRAPRPGFRAPASISSKESAYIHREQP